MSTYIKISFQSLTQEQSEILLALLADINYEAFEEGKDWLVAWIPEREFEEEILKSTIEFLDVSYTREEQLPKNWNQVWENSFQPVVVDDFCRIRAAFHESVPGCRYEIVITPKMSFGTGHHATTYLMIAAMRDLDFKEKSVLDFGTGTGVLAILAEKMGAQRVVAIDNDDWSISNASENILVNGSKVIALQQADFVPAGEKFEIILANINKNVLSANMASMQQQLKEGGVLLLSGLLQGDFEVMKAEAVKYNLRVSSSMERNGWIVIKLN